MSQKALTENLYVYQAMKADAWTAGTYYNGQASASGIGIDTKGYDEAMVILNGGALTSNGTVDVSLTATASNSTAAAQSTAISGASFTQLTTANDESVYVGRVKTKDQARYLFVKAVVANQTADAGCVVVLGKADTLPVTQGNTVAFNV